MRFRLRHGAWTLGFLTFAMFERSYEGDREMTYGNMLIEDTR